MKFNAVIQKKDKPILVFENRELFVNYLNEHIGKTVVLDIKLQKIRSVKQNSLYFQAVEYFGTLLFFTDTREVAKENTHQLLKDYYCAYELKQVPRVIKIGAIEKHYYDFSISFDKADEPTVTKYYARFCE